MVFLHFDFNSIMNSSLVIHQRNFNCKKKKSQKVTSFTRKFFLPILCFIILTHNKHIFISTIFANCRIPYKYKRKKMRFKIEYTIFSVLTFSTIDICMKKSTNFNSIFTQRKVKNVPLHPLCNQIISNFSPFFSQFFEK